MQSDFKTARQTIRYDISLKRIDLLSDLSIVHIITTKCDNKVIKHLAKLYMTNLSNMCSNINVNYSRINLVNTDDDYIKQFIIDLNNDPSVNGIIFDFPFIVNNKSDIFKRYIKPSKDIGFYSEKTLIRYHDNSNVVPPYLFITNTLQNLYTDKSSFNSYTIIESSNSSSCTGLIPYQNYNHCKYTLVTNLHDYVNDYDSNVVISLMTNISMIKEYKITRKRYSPNLVIDFGYTVTGKLGSLDRGYFTKDVPYYTWGEDLLDLYMYGLINNLINKYRKDNLYD